MRLAAWRATVATSTLPEALGLVALFLLFTRISDVYRPSEWPLSVNQVLVAATLGVLLLAGRRLRLDRGIGWMLAYGGAIGLSALAAANRLSTLAALAAYLHDVVIVLAIVSLVTSWQHLRVATWTIVAGGAGVGALAAVHLFTGNDLGGLSSVDFGNIAGDDAGFRLAGTIGNSNAFAQMLVCAVPFALYAAWTSGSARARWAGLGAAVLIGAVIVQTFSRSGALAFLVVLGLAVVYRRFQRTVVLTVALVAAVAVLAAPRLYWNRVTITGEYVSASTADAVAGGSASAPAPVPRVGGQPEALRAEGATPEGPTASAPTPSAATRDYGSLPERSRLWQVGMLMFLDQPLTGIGKNNYLLVYPRYAGRVDASLLADPKVAHSTPVQVLADTGAIGLATLSGLLLVVLFGLRASRKRIESAGLARDALLLEAIEIGIYGYLVTSLFASDDFPRFLWLLLGLAMAARQIVDHAVKTTPRAATAPVRSPAGVWSAGVSR